GGEGGGGRGGGGGGGAGGRAGDCVESGSWSCVRVPPSRSRQAAMGRPDRLVSTQAYHAGSTFRCGEAACGIGVGTLSSPPCPSPSPLPSSARSISATVPTPTTPTCSTDSIPARR